MRAGPQLGVAKAARAPPCTLPILGQRFHSHNNKLFSQSTHLPYHSLKDSQHIISVFRVMVFMSKLQDFLHFLTILQHQNFIYLT